MAPRDIVQATTKNCIDYQRASAAFADDARYFRDQPYGQRAAIKCQQHSREYHDAAWDRLARLIGVE